jgi:hypothetical protein
MSLTDKGNSPSDPSLFPSKGQKLCCKYALHIDRRPVPIEGELIVYYFGTYANVLAESSTSFYR